MIGERLAILGRASCSVLRVVELSWARALRVGVCESPYLLLAPLLLEGPLLSARNSW